MYMCIYISLSVSLCLSLSLSLSLYIYIYSSISTHLPACLLTHPSNRSPTQQTTSLLSCLASQLPTNLPTDPPIYLTACLPACLPACLSVGLPIHLTQNQWENICETEILNLFIFLQRNTKVFSSKRFKPRTFWILPKTLLALRILSQKSS